MASLILMMWKIIACFSVIGCILHHGFTFTGANSIESRLQNEVPIFSEEITSFEESETSEPTSDPFRFLILCAPGFERRNICEKCTKVTRNPITYKMCCENLHGVGTWCKKFLNPSDWISDDTMKEHS